MVSRPYGEPSIARKDTRRAFVTALSSREKRDNIVRYRVSYEHSHHRIWRTLVDRGANGCILGKDTRVVHLTDQYIDLNGIDDHTVRNLRIGTGAGLVMSNQGLPMSGGQFLRYFRAFPRKLSLSHWPN